MSRDLPINYSFLTLKKMQPNETSKISLANYCRADPPISSH